MKAIVFALLAIVACVHASYSYIVPPAPCAWSIKIESKALFSYMKTVYSVHGRYEMAEMYDFRGNLIYSGVLRPDFGESVAFKYDVTGTCEVETEPYSAITFADVLSSGGCVSGEETVFDYVDDAKYDGKSCRVYYNNNAYGEPDLNGTALYVNKATGFPYACVTKASASDTRTVTTFSLSTFAPMSEFTFSKFGVYKCSDNRIFTTPSNLYAKCAASSVKVTIPLFILVALLAFFF